MWDVGCRIVRGKKTRQTMFLMVQRVSLRGGVLSVLCGVLCPDDAEIFNSPSLESDTKDNTQGNKD